MIDNNWVYRPMPKELHSLAETAAEAFVSQLSAVADGVTAGGHAPNEVFSVQAHVLASGIEYLVGQFQKRGTELYPDLPNLPVEAAIGILLNDTMARFWMIRRESEGAVKRD